MTTEKKPRKVRVKIGRDLQFNLRMTPAEQEKFQRVVEGFLPKKNKTAVLLALIAEKFESLTAQK
jgi:hypothetical protein